MKRLLNFLKKHKKASVFFVVILVGAGAWFGYQSWKTAPAETRYVTSVVQKGTISSSVTGTGQVSVTDQLDVKAKASGDVVSVPVVNGQAVKTGDLLASLNATDALKAVRDAQANVDSAKISLQKLQEPTDTYSILQAQNSLANAQNSLAKLKLSQPDDLQSAQDARAKLADDQTKTYQDAYDAVANAYLDLPDIMTELDDVLNSTAISDSESTLNNGQANADALLDSISTDDQSAFLPFRSSAKSDEAAAKLAFDQNFADQKATLRTADPATIDALLNETISTVTTMSQAIKSETNMLSIWADDRTRNDWTIFSQVATYQSDLGRFVSTTNSHLSTLTADQQTLKNDTDSLASEDRTIAQLVQNQPLDLAAAEASVTQAQASLDKLSVGPDPLDVQSSELSLKQRENALTDAYATLADASVRAPFDGVLADVAVKKGDSVSSGGTIATLITTQRTAVISLNEVDAAKIAVGQKATITFDAIDGLSVTGEVGELDALGTVSQGVVTYDATILFDTQDDRVKPGMSVSAAIITDVKTDALIVPSGAVKTVNGSSFVQMFDQPLEGGQSSQGATSSVPPHQVPVEVGISNDTDTEITSGVKEGDEVVTRTITGTTTAAASSAPSLFGGGGSGGTFRSTTAGR